jgi:endonuclease/exonuclease/phosphatase (EEP) superfamily protein YafD
VVRIDHVLLGDQLASLGTRTVDIAGSDHYGLIATVARRG